MREQWSSSMYGEDETSCPSLVSSNQRFLKALANRPIS